MFAGDYDGDGIGDLAVSEAGYQTTSAVEDHYDASGNVCHTTAARIMAPTLLFLGPITSDRLDTDAEGIFFGAVPVGAGDFDNDGRSDIVLRQTAESESESQASAGVDPDLYVVSGGTFGVGYPGDVAMATIAEGGVSWADGPLNFSPGQIAVADFDADGALDLGVGGPSMSFLTGPLLGSMSLSADGTAAFSAPIGASYGGDSYTVTPAGDVNGDGFPDALITNSNGSSQPYGWLVPGPIIGALDTTDALGSFNSDDPWTRGALVRGAPVGDWNGDGRGDLLLGGWYAAYVIHGE